MDESSMDEIIAEHSKWVAQVGGDPDGFIDWVNDVRAAAWAEGYLDAQHDEHEYRPGRKTTNPYKDKP